MRKGFLLLGFALLLVGCGSGASAPVPTFVPPTFGALPTPSPLLGRTTTLVMRGDLIDTVTARGELVAEPQAALVFETGGVLTVVNVTPGDVVTKGDVLAEFDATTLQRAALQSASTLAIAKLELAQEEELRADIPYAVDIARERVALALALDQYAQAQVEKTVLVAPFSGTLVSFAKQRGDTVKAYESVGILADIENLQVQAMLPVDAVAFVDVGQAVEVGLNSKTYAATIQSIAPVAQLLQGQSVQEATLRFDAGQAIPPLVGIGVDVRLVRTLRENALLVPADAVITVAGQTYLDVLSDGSVIQRVPVVVGPSAGGAIEIASGVEEGQTVVLP